MAGTQFIGKEPMIAAYAKVCNGDELPWALFQGKKKRQGGEGEDSLNEWLDIFAPAGSTASYTLCVYPEGTDTDNVSINTECIACWDFKLSEYRGGEGGAVGGLQRRLEDKVAGMVIERLDKLEKKLDEDRDDEPDTIGKAINNGIMKLLENPDSLAGLIGQVVGFLRGGGTVAPAPAAAIGAFNPAAQPQSEEELYNRLSKVLDRLQVDNPALIEQLEKLADIKEKKPDTFKFLISNLNAL